MDMIAVLLPLGCNFDGLLVIDGWANTDFLIFQKLFESSHTISSSNITICDCNKEMNLINCAIPWRKIMDKVVVVVGDRRLGGSYYRPFADIAPQGDCELIFTRPKQVLCAVFTGGEDVDPSFYGRSRNSKTNSNAYRDKEEQMFFREAAKHHIPMAGICRGAQFLCAMNGGILAQHITGHGGNHPIRTLNGIIEVTSTHHQMQIPPGGAIMLAWADPKRSKCYEGENDEELYPKYEAEGVYYPATQSLGMQWHPEFMRKESEGFQYSVSLIQKLLRSELG